MRSSCRDEDHDNIGGIIQIGNPSRDQDHGNFPGQLLGIKIIVGIQAIPQ